jgi:hypothetical protein
MGLIKKTEIMELQKKQLIEEIHRLKNDKTRDSKLRIQKLQQQIDLLGNGEHK